MIFVRTSLECDGADCPRAMTAKGANRIREVKAAAELDRWLFFGRSHFCPDCRINIDKFLNKSHSEPDPE